MLQNHSGNPKNIMSKRNFIFLKSKEKNLQGTYFSQKNYFDQTFLSRHAENFNNLPGHIFNCETKLLTLYGNILVPFLYFTIIVHILLFYI